MEFMEFIIKLDDNNIDELVRVYTALHNVEVGNINEFREELLKKIPSSSLLTADESLSIFLINRLNTYYGFDVTANTRKSEVVFPRQLGMTILKLFTKLSLKSVGEKFNKTNHATVIHAIRTVANLYETSREKRFEIVEFINFIDNKISIEIFEQRLKVKKIIK